MTNIINAYRDFTRTTAQYPKEVALDYLIHGLTSEAGEVAGKFKKTLRGDKAFDKEALLSELGDVFWYAFRIADELDVDVEAVLAQNIYKLSDRKERDVIKGDGDTR